MNTTCKVLLTLALLAAFNCKAVGKLMIKPKDTDAKINQSTFFNCSSDIGPTAIFWYHGIKFVYTGSVILEPYQQRFEVDKSERNGTYIYNLVIHSVQPSDAGEYRCEEDEGFGENYSVQLVVIEDRDPTCRSNMELNEVVGQNSCNIEPDEVELECSVTYSGNIPPRLEWERIGKHSTASLKASVVSSLNQCTSTLKLKGDITLNNYSYVCRTKRTIQEPSNCTFKIIKILYAFSDNFTVNKTTDEEIHCSANTSQSCSYNWRWLQDNDFTIESSTAVLQAKKPGWHRCEAECYIRNKTCNFLVMRAMVSGKQIEESSQTRNIIFALVVIAVVVVAAVSVLVVVFVNRHKQECCSKISETESSTTEEKVSLDEKSDRIVYGICGLTILHEEVFILYSKGQYIEVYGSTEFQLRRRLLVGKLTDAGNIVSCTVNNCLYTTDSKYQKLFPAILRIDPMRGNRITTWKIPEEIRWGKISVASDTNVILSPGFRADLHEYTADGKLIRLINVKELFGCGVRYAIKLDDGFFVVSRSEPGGVYLLSTKESYNTLGRFDEVEIVRKLSEDSEDFSMKSILLVNNKGSILVENDNSDRVMLLNLNPDIKSRVLISKEDGIIIITGMCFKEATGEWIVTDGNRIIVCRLEGETIERNIRELNGHT